MNARSKIAKKLLVLDCKQPLVVGVVHSTATLQAALDLVPETAPDWLELRVDAFADRPEALDEIAATSSRPLLVTVRHPAEGSLASGIKQERREELFARFLPRAAAIDVEVRSLSDMRETVKAAQERNVSVVASYHDFAGTPSLRRLRSAATSALKAGADIFKAATTVERPGDLASLFLLLETENGIGVSAMGMGRLGRASRPALAAAGSILNYGYLGRSAQIPGQWPVAKLRARIDELTDPL